MHLPPLIQDLAVILMVAALMTILFRAIRQPLVLGYIVAGFLVGPHFTWLPTVVDKASVHVWSEIGVIFLLFALGLEFSFKKLARVGAPASITAVVEVIGMVGLGYVTGLAFGWRAMDSLFLGGILAISSTTIIIRAFDELKLKSRGFARLVFGVLIVEDLVAILLLVLLSTVAVSRNFSGLDLGYSALKLVFFLTLWFVLGIFLVPSMLTRARRFLSPETLLIVAVGLCFLMVTLATQAGFSPALGAFIMGSILAETVDGERIEHMIQPLKDLFGAVFFVSVGMLIDPQVLVDYAFPIFVITVVTILGKTLTTSVGALFAGQSLRHSVQTGLSLAQIGEFSFIIAGLGLSLKVTSEFLYPLAISVSAITTFTTPYLIQSADAVVQWLQRHLPARWLNALERFRSATNGVAYTSDWQTFLQRVLMRTLTNGVVVAAIFLLVAQYVQPWLVEQFAFDSLASVLSVLLAFVLSSPFLWVLTLGRLERELGEELWRQPEYRRPLMGLLILRWTFVIGLCGLLVLRMVPAVSVVMAVGVLFALALFARGRSLEGFYRLLEGRFVRNLHERDEKERSTLPPLAPWDAHLTELKVAPNANLCGRTLSEAALRERFGISVALIQRGRKLIPAPHGLERIFPGDLLHVIGTDEEIQRLRTECDDEALTEAATDRNSYELRRVLVDAEDSFLGRTIRESGLRELTEGLVVGIEKDGQRTLNPDSSTRLSLGDVLWIVGHCDRLDTLK